MARSFRELVAGNLGYGDPLEIAEAERLADETSKMLWSISSKL